MDPSWIPALRIVPFIVIGAVLLMIKMARIFTTHQQKMAEILNRTNNDHAELAALRNEIAQLKSLVQDSVIRSDDARMRVPPTPDLGDRLRSNV